MSGVAFTPLGGRLGVLQTGQGGLFCPMLARVATVGRKNPCRAGPAYLCLRQVLRPGQGHQLDRVVMGRAWAGLWVAVLPHKGRRETLANPELAAVKPWPGSSQLRGPGPAVVNRGHPSANVKE